MTYIHRVSFDLKGIEAEYATGQRTALVGKNRQGKTTIRDAIELATRGRHSVGTRTSDVLELFGPDQESIFARVEGEAWKAMCTMQLDPTGKPSEPSWRRKGINDGELIGLLPEFGDQLKGDRLAREALFVRFGPGSIPQPKGLSKVQREMWTAGIEDAGDVPAASLLPALSAYFRAKKNGLGREAGALSRQLEAIRERLGDGAGAEDLPNLERRLAQLPDKTENQKTIEGLIAAARLTREQIAEVEAKIERAEKVINSDKCPTCKRAAPPELTRKAAAAIPKRQDEAKRLRAELTAIEQRWGQLGEYEVERSHLNEQIAELSETSGDARTIDAESERLAEMKAQQDAAKFLEGRATKLMTQLLDEVRINAEQEVNSAMIPGFVASLEFDAKKCRWTVRDEKGKGRRRTASGSELAALTIGLTVAWGARILFLDDVDIGTITCENLTGLCDVLDIAIDKGQIDQAILVVDPDRAHRIPKNWKIIEID